MTDEPPPEPLGYLLLAGVAVEVTGVGSFLGPFLTEALFGPLVVLAEAAPMFWAGWVDALGPLALPIATEIVLLSAWLFLSTRREAGDDV